MKKGIGDLYAKKTAFIPENRKRNCISFCPVFSDLGHTIPFLNTFYS